MAQHWGKEEQFTIAAFYQENTVIRHPKPTKTNGKKLQIHQNKLDDHRPQDCADAGMKLSRGTVIEGVWNSNL